MLATLRSLLDRITPPTIVLSYVAALVAFLVSIVMIAEGQPWFVSLGYVSWTSVGSVGVIYALAQFRFKSVGYTGMKSMVLGVMFANAFLQCYEVAYGFTFGLAALVNDPLTVTGTDIRQLLLWLIMIAPVLLVYEHLRFKRTSAALLALTAAVWALWILYGFPQYYYSGYSFAQVLETSDPYHTSLWLNFGSKALLAAFFVSLLEPFKGLQAALFRMFPMLSPKREAAPLA